MTTSLKDISLAQVVDTMAEGVFVVDESHRIVLWNKAMELLTGYPQAEVLGKAMRFGAMFAFIPPNKV